MEMRSLRRICGVNLADRIRNEVIQRMAGTSEDIMRMKKNVLCWFRHVERTSDERMAKKIYCGKVSGKRDRGRYRLTLVFSKNAVSKILEEGHIKSMRTMMIDISQDVDDRGRG